MLLPPRRSQDDRMSIREVLDNSRPRDQLIATPAVLQWDPLPPASPPLATEPWAAPSRLSPWSERASSPESLLRSECAPGSEGCQGNPAPSLSAPRSRPRAGSGVDTIPASSKCQTRLTRPQGAKHAEPRAWTGEGPFRLEHTGRRASDCDTLVAEQDLLSYAEDVRSPADAAQGEVVRTLPGNDHGIRDAAIEPVLAALDGGGNHADARCGGAKGGRGWTLRRYRHEDA
jgi:hypothetical protein